MNRFKVPGHSGAFYCFKKFIWLIFHLYWLIFLNFGYLSVIYQNHKKYQKVCHKYKRSDSLVESDLFHVLRLLIFQDWFTCRSCFVQTANYCCMWRLLNDLRVFFCLFGNLDHDIHKGIKRFF